MLSSTITAPPPLSNHACLISFARVNLQSMSQEMQEKEYSIDIQVANQSVNKLVTRNSS
jgi:hypothetical protein